MEIDLEMDLSTTQMGTGGTMEISPILHRLQGKTSHKKLLAANQEVINLSTLPSAALTTYLPTVLHLTNTSSHKAIIRHHPMWFASPQAATPIKNYQILSAR